MRNREKTPLHLYPFLRYNLTAIPFRMRGKSQMDAQRQGFRLNRWWIVLILAVATVWCFVDVRRRRPLSGPKSIGPI